MITGSGGPDLNRRPSRWQRDVLPTELPPLVPGPGVAPGSHVFQTRAVTTLATLAILSLVGGEGLEPPTFWM